jgi:hypothetical protein
MILKRSADARTACLRVLARVGVDAVDAASEQMTLQRGREAAVAVALLQGWMSSTDLVFRFLGAEGGVVVVEAVAEVVVIPLWNMTWSMDLAFFPWTSAVDGDVCELEDAEWAFRRDLAVVGQRRQSLHHLQRCWLRHLCLLMT